MTILMAIFGLHTNAQCTPDQSITQPGIYPDSATNFMPAYVGYPYEQVVQAVIPQDTCIVIISPPCQTVPIQSIDVVSVSGLPPNFAYDCNPGTCSFPGGTVGCVRFYSTQSPTINDTGTYNLVIQIEGITATTPPITQSNSVTYYKIEIKDSTGVGVGVSDKVADLAELNIFPNPGNEQVFLAFKSDKNTRGELMVYGVDGVLVEQRSINLIKGDNRVAVQTSSWPSGVYSFVLNTESATRSKRLMVQH